MKTNPFKTNKNQSAKKQLRAVILIPILLLLISCSNNDDAGDSTITVPVIEEDIIGSWTPGGGATNETWQFLDDGTFIDTENNTYEYQLQRIDGIIYVAFDREGLGLNLSEEELAGLEENLGQTEFIPIYSVIMPSQDSLVLEPASVLYGSDIYFGVTFQTYILQRQ